MSPKPVRLRLSTYENVLPVAIVSPEEQAMLPQVSRDGPVCLKVHEIRISCARMAEGAYAQCQILMVGDVVRKLSKQRWAWLASRRVSVHKEETRSAHPHAPGSGNLRNRLEFVPPARFSPRASFRPRIFPSDG